MILRRTLCLLDPLKSSILQNYSAMVLPALETCMFSTNFSKPDSSDPADEKFGKNINKAMKSYLERAQEHDEFMKQQREEFQIGKRHLANMMGEDPESFTQQDIDNAIEYLFPSGLYEKHARPLMKPPEEIFPQRKAAEFDETGRPHHFLFYTGKPNYYQVLHNIVQHINDLYQYENVMLRKNLKPDAKSNLDLSGYQWLDKVSLEKKLLETIGDKDYDHFVNAIERLSILPYSYRAKDFIFQYTKVLMNQVETYEAPKPQYDSEGRAYVTTYECLRKTARGDVTIKMPGTGKITINGEDITYFKDIQSREQYSWLKIKFNSRCNVITCPSKAMRIWAFPRLLPNISTVPQWVK